MKKCKKLQALEDLVEAVKQGNVVLNTVAMAVSKDHDHGRAPMDLILIAKATQRVNLSLMEKMG